MRAFIVSVAFLFSSALSGQEAPAKAPPGVEEALRARATQFYQFLVDSKFRQAEQLVAEESKDSYYNSEKPRFLSFEIGKIEFEDNFTKATVWVPCKRNFMMPGFAGTPMTTMVASRWKLADGQWFYFIDPNDLKRMPFFKPGVTPAGAAPAGFPGMSAPAPGTADGQAPAKLPPLPSPAQAMAMIRKVSLEKQSVTIDPAKPFSESVAIVNQMPGKVTLKLAAPKVAGLEVKLEKAALDRDERGALSIRYTPPKKPGAALLAPVDVTVTVEQTGILLPLRIGFGQ